MKKSGILNGAIILAVASVIAKLIGALYRIPLTNILGAEGIGLYQMIFPLYTVLLTISSGGIPVAISRVVAARITKNDHKGALKVLGVALVSLTIVGAVCCLLIVIGRVNIATLQGNSKAQIAYLGIAPSLVFVCVIAAIRGYFQGTMNMLPSAISHLTEQFIKLGAGIVLSTYMVRFGVEYGVLGALIGVSLSEFVASILLIIQLVLHKRRLNRRRIVTISSSMLCEASVELTAGNQLLVSGEIVQGKAPDDRIMAILVSIYRIAIPVTLGSLVLPLTGVIDSVLVINILSITMSASSATAMYGLLNGPINSLINMPTVITLSLAIAVLPRITASLTIDDGKREETISGTMKLSWIIGLLCFLIFAVYSEQILRILYSKGLSEEQLVLGTLILRVGSISIILVSILQVATACLQALDKAHLPAVNLLVGAVVKVVITIVLLPLIGIMGAMIASVCCYLITMILTSVAMLRHMHLSISSARALLLPMLGAVAFVVVGIVAYRAANMIMPMIFAAAISAVLSVSAYFAVIFSTRCLTIRQLKNILRSK